MQVGESCPEIYVKGGVMERGNFSACAGFASHSGRCAVFGTFAAFQEMILSEAPEPAQVISTCILGHGSNHNFKIASGSQFLASS